MKKIEINRRDFIKGSAVVGAAAAAVIAGKEILTENATPEVAAKNGDNQNAKPSCLELAAALSAKK